MLTEIERAFSDLAKPLDRFVEKHLVRFFENVGDSPGERALRHERIGETKSNRTV